MSDPRTEMVLLVEAPLQDAKNMRAYFEEQQLEATLLLPEACGRQA